MPLTAFIRDSRSHVYIRASGPRRDTGQLSTPSCELSDHSLILHTYITMSFRFIPSRYGNRGLSQREFASCDSDSRDPLAPGRIVTQDSE